MRMYRWSRNIIGRGRGEHESGTVMHPLAQSGLPQSIKLQPMGCLTTGHNFAAKWVQEPAYVANGSAFHTSRHV